MAVEEQPRASGKSVLRDVVETLVFTLLIYILVRTFLFENYRVEGRSMEPSLVDDQYLVVDKLGYRLHEPQRGDIIVFQDPNNDGRKLIKRVIGLPGESVEIRNGQVFIDGQLLDEKTYISSSRQGRYTEEATRLPEDEYFVLGDNRNNSSDSHNWGTLPSQNIIGKAWLTYWPPASWGAIPHEAYGDQP